MATDLLERPETASPTTAAGEDTQVLVTLTVADQLCGVPVLAVRDILGEQVITRIPLAPPEIAGSLNLRGRIVTAIDLRRRLKLSPAPAGTRRRARVCPGSRSESAEGRCGDRCCRASRSRGHAS